jgi:hypothetical protein
MTLIVGLVCLALGIAAGWFGHRKWGVGPPTPLPSPPEPEALADEFFDQLTAQRKAEDAAAHAEWDAEWRKLCPPPAGIVWQRSVTGRMVEWPERSYSPKGTKITDFNN